MRGSTIILLNYNGVKKIKLRQNHSELNFDSSEFFEDVTF